MNYTWIAIAAIAALVAYFIVGGTFFMSNAFKEEFVKHSAVYRGEGTKGSLMAMGMGGLFLAILVASAIFARIHPEGGNIVMGIKFGALLALFQLGSFVLHNHMQLKISGRMSALQAVVYTAEWVVVGVVISLVYRG